MKSKWKDQTLGEVLDVIRNGLNCKQTREGDGDPISRIETIATGEFNHEKVGRSILSEADKDKHRLKIGDILFSHINSPPHIGKSALLRSNDTIYHGVNLLLFRPKGHVDSGFLQRYLSHLHLSEFWRSRCKQSVNQASVNQTDIKGVHISLPPLEEQQLIVAILDKAFEGLARARANAEANLQNTRELFAETVTALFRGIPKPTESSTLGELADFRNGLNFTRTSQGVEVRIVGVGDFKDNFEVPTASLSQIRINGELSADDKLQAGDVLAVRSNGNRNLIGRTMLVPEIIEPISFSGFTIRIRLKTDRLSPHYLCAFMRTKQARTLLTAGGGGANISNLNQRLLSSFPIVFPSLETQANILARLEDLTAITDQLREGYQTKLQDLDDLRQSLLQKAFAGELT